jgi:hypothetical protein
MAWGKISAKIFHEMKCDDCKKIKSDLILLYLSKIKRKEGRKVRWKSYIGKLSKSFGSWSDGEEIRDISRRSRDIWEIGVNHELAIDLRREDGISASAAKVNPEKTRVSVNDSSRRELGDMVWIYSLLVRFLLFFEYFGVGRILWVWFYRRTIGKSIWLGRLVVEDLCVERSLYRLVIHLMGWKVFAIRDCQRICRIGKRKETKRINKVPQFRQFDAEGLVPSLARPLFYLLLFTFLNQNLK